MNKPIKTLNMSLKRPDGIYLALGNNATWDNIDYNWSIKVDSLRELLKLIDSGDIEPKKGYVGGKCKVFENNNETIVLESKIAIAPPIDATFDYTNDNIPF